MKYILVIFNLIIVTVGFGQKFDLKIDSVIGVEIERLKRKNVSEVGYTKLACINYGIRTTSYLFWIDNENTYIQKFEDEEYSNSGLHRFALRLITDSVFFAFYKRNSEALISEEVKAFSSDPRTETIVSHSCYRNFKLFVNGSIFKKNFNFFDLEEFDGETKRNLSYTANKDLKIVEWDTTLSKFLKSLEDKEKFIEIKN